MAYVIPNEADAAFADMAELHSNDIQNSLAKQQCGCGVITGCAVTAQGSPDMTLAVAVGVAVVDGKVVAVTAGNVTIGTADGSNPRFDLVYVDNTGAKGVEAGTAAANPTLPAVSANRTVIAVVFVPASDTAIQTNQIRDARIMMLPYGTLARVFATTTWVSSTAENNLFSYTVPGGLIGLTGRLRLTLSGDYLNNTAANQTGTLRIKLGGTTLFNDASGNIATGTVRRPWRLVVEIQNMNAQNSQFMHADWMMGNIVAATTGLGDFATSGLRQTVLSSNGLVAIDTSASAAFDVSWQHGASNAALDIRVHSACLELI